MKFGLTMFATDYAISAVDLGRAAEDGPELVIAPCDRRRLEEVRRNWPFLRDRRIDAYADLQRRMIG